MELTCLDERPDYIVQTAIEDISEDLIRFALELKTQPGYAELAEKNSEGYRYCYIERSEKEHKISCMEIATSCRDHKKGRQDESRIVSDFVAYVNCMALDSSTTEVIIQEMKYSLENKPGNTLTHCVPDIIGKIPKKGITQKSELP